MLDSGELIPQWLKTRTNTPTKRVGPQTMAPPGLLQPMRSVPVEMVKRRPCYRPAEFLDEREARPEGRKELRRTHSEVQCTRRSVSPGGVHARSQSAWDFVGSRHTHRGTPDHGRQSSQSSISSESVRPSSQTGRSSRLADLPEGCGPFSRYSPEIRTEAVYSPAAAKFSRLIDSPSTNEDVDAAEIQRIQFEQSKKLIPVVQPRNTPRSRRSSRSPLTPMGKTSPVAQSAIRVDGHSMPISVGNAKRHDWKSEGGCHSPDGIASKEQDRKSFFKSLMKNKPMNDKCDSDSTASKGEIKDSSSTGESIDGYVPIEKKDDVEDHSISVVPPSIEEERFLRSLGWDDSDEVDLLTDEEIAAFKAQYLNKAVDNASQRAQCKSGHLRSLQGSPVGPFAAFDLVADIRSESMSTI